MEGKAVVSDEVDGAVVHRVLRLHQRLVEGLVRQVVQRVLQQRQLRVAHQRKQLVQRNFGSVDHLVLHGAVAALTFVGLERILREVLRLVDVWGHRLR